MISAIQHRPTLSLIVALGALVLASSADGALIKLDLDKLTARSEHIVCGQVTGLHSYYSDVPNLGRVIVTDVTVKVSETWKGRARKTITLQVFGGKVGEDREYCAESPTYTVGEKVLVFIKSWQGATWNTGWLQGKYTLEDAEGGGVRVRGKAHLPISSVKSLGAVRADVTSLVEKQSRSGK